jgi:2-polyprenyl-3-methyl-5-hydroxy-6-metoxy-1,4-benzoquinol methylase
MTNTSRSKFAASINKLLRKVGFQLVRSTTLEKLAGIEFQLTELAPLGVRVATLESRLNNDGIKNVISYAMKTHWRTVDLIEQIIPSDPSLRCALCGHVGDFKAFEQIESTCQFFGGQLLRHHCPTCDVIFGPQKMLQLDEQMLGLEYRNLYRIYAEGDNTESTIHTFELLSPKRGGTYLDFGCGGEWSAAIAKLRQEGWDIYGFEPNIRNSSEHVFSTWAEVEQRRFNGILSHNVLEHLFDPAGTTRQLSTLLTPGGLLVHATPCFEYTYQYSRFHVFFFTGRSPNVLARNADMRITDWSQDGEIIACTMERSTSQ